jgi:polypeptide deformylase
VARGFTDRGDPVQIVGSATLARCLQHETDHLDAILFIDRMDPPPGNSPCGRSARRRGAALIPRRSASPRILWAAARV